jgi:hypothetical protein
MWKKCQDLTRMAVAMVAEIAEHGDQDAAD